jgi:hypothetical protein
MMNEVEPEIERESDSIKRFQVSIKQSTHFDNNKARVCMRRRELNNDEMDRCICESRVCVENDDWQLIISSFFGKI